MKKLYKLVLLLLLFLVPLKTNANDKVNIYLFYSYTCPHCHKADVAIQDILSERNDVNYYKYECLKETNAYNRTMLNEVKEIMNIERTAFPTVIIGNEYIIGFGDNTKDEYNKLIDFYKENEYKDEVGILLGLVDENDKEVIKKDKEYKSFLEEYDK